MNTQIYIDGKPYTGEKPLFYGGEKAETPNTKTENVAAAVAELKRRRGE